MTDAVMIDAVGRTIRPADDVRWIGCVLASLALHAAVVGFLPAWEYAPAALEPPRLDVVIAPVSVAPEPPPPPEQKVEPPAPPKPEPRIEPLPPKPEPRVQPTAPKAPPPRVAARREVTPIVEPPAPKPSPVVEARPPEPVVPRQVLPPEAVATATPPEPPLTEPLPQRVPEPAAQVASKNVDVAVAAREPAFTPPRTDADYLHNPRPRYPARALREGEQGTTLVKVLVSAEGRPLAVEVAKTSGSRLLDEAAIDAVRSWKFVPATKGGEPVQGTVMVPLVFKLEERG